TPGPGLCRPWATSPNPLADEWASRGRRRPPRLRRFLGRLAALRLLSLRHDAFPLHQREQTVSLVRLCAGPEAMLASLSCALGPRSRDRTLRARRDPSTC